MRIVPAFSICGSLTRFIDSATRSCAAWEKRRSIREKRRSDLASPWRATALEGNSQKRYELMPANYAPRASHAGTAVSVLRRRRERRLARA